MGGVAPLRVFVCARYVVFIFGYICLCYHIFLQIPKVAKTIEFT